MLKAIAIYKCETNLSKNGFKCERELSIQQEGHLFYNENIFATLEKTIIPKLTPKDVTTACAIKNNNDYYYVKMVDKKLYAITSKKKLEQTELAYLFRNINNAYKSNAAKTQLKKIIDNPLGYTGSDSKLKKVQLAADELRVVAVQLVEQTLQRSEKIETVVAMSDQLQLESKKFHKNTKDLNPCCRI